MKKNKLFIVAGATGELGAECIKLIPKNMKVISISRKTAPKVAGSNVKHLYFDLTSLNEIQKNLDNLELGKFSDIYFLHSIGSDKFEMQEFPAIKPLPTIDPEVYHSNVNTYKFLEKYLIGRINEINQKGQSIRLHLAMFASVADRHNVIFLTSFSESKNIVRSYMRNAVENYPKWISAYVINISSMVTKSGLSTRPFAETTFFLKPSEVAKKSLKNLMSHVKGYKECDIIKKDPNFTQDYYKNSEKIFKRWMKFVYGN